MVAGFAALVWLWDQHPQLHRLGKIGCLRAGGEKKQSALGALGESRALQHHMQQLRRVFLILGKLQSPANGSSSSCMLKLCCISLKYARDTSVLRKGRIGTAGDAPGGWDQALDRARG